MKRLVVLFTALIIGSTMFSQKMITRSGEIKFDATVPGAMDEVIGTNKTVSAIFDKSTTDLVVLGLVKSFKFKSLGNAKALPVGLYKLSISATT